MTPEQRRLRAKIAAYARWAHPMARADQADAARAAIFARLEHQVDPAGTLPPDQRARLVHAAALRLSAELNAARARKHAVGEPSRRMRAAGTRVHGRTRADRRGRYAHGKPQPGRAASAPPGGHTAPGEGM